MLGEFVKGKTPRINLAALATADEVKQIARHEVTHAKLTSEKGDALLTAFSKGRMTLQTTKRLEAKYPRLIGEALQRARVSNPNLREESRDEYLKRTTDEHLAEINQTQPTVWKELVQQVKEFLAMAGVRDLTTQEVEQ